MPVGHNVCGDSVIKERVVFRFLDRIEERMRLEKLLSSSSGRFCCLYGRRRCGKTRLLEECLKNRSDVLYYVADRTDRAAQISRFLKEAAVLNPAFGIAECRNWSAVMDLWAVLAPRGAVLVFDEFPYLVEQDDALTSVLQRIVDKLSDTGRKIIICGSSQRMMQGFVLKASEPLYGRAHEILPIMPLTFEWMKAAFPEMSPWDRLKAWGVWGGVPRYWELQDEEQDLWTAVRRNVTSPLGILRNEPQFLLLDDVGDVAQASAVMSFIGVGAHRAGEIAARMQRPITDMSRPFQRLTELGLVTKDVPFGADANCKKSFYRISDPFLDFWYAFVQPNLSNAGFLESRLERKSFDAVGYLPHLGGVWERLVREEIQRRPLPGRGDCLQNAARWWGTGLDRRAMEIDVVAESLDGETLFVGEAKLSLSASDVENTLAELEAKARQLPFAHKYSRITSTLFVARNPPPGAVSIDWLEG